MSNPSRSVILPSAFGAGVWVGLWLPDIDFALLPILHHRSIITHSLLIPWLASLYLSQKISVATISGLYAGIAIHLSADVLSPMVGFGMIWLPWPIKVPLGSASAIWIAANALIGIWMALRLSPERKMLIFGFLLLVALAYAVMNENAVMPFVAFGIFGSIVFWLTQRRSKRVPKENRKRRRNMLERD
jgi:hypothetical protein